MASYRPVSGAHAIEQAVVGIRLSAPSAEAVYGEAVSKAAELAVQAGLPGRVQLDPLSLLFGRQAISPGYSTAELTQGTAFQRVEQDGSMAEELTLERGAVTFRTNRYRRWADMVTHIDSVLAPVASIMAEGDMSRMSVIELRCVDRFVSDSEETPPLENLIKRDSPFITAHLIERQDFLHIHSGWFENQSDAGRTLYNLNIEVAPGSSGRTNATVLQVISNQASGNGHFFRTDTNFNDVLMENFQNLHAADKRLLGRLLSDELQREVNLQGSSGIGEV